MLSTEARSPEESYADRQQRVGGNYGGNNNDTDQVIRCPVSCVDDQPQSLKWGPLMGANAVAAAGGIHLLVTRTLATPRMCG